MTIWKVLSEFFLGQTSIHKCSSRKRGRITISWFPKKDFPLRSSCQSLVNNFWYYCIQRVKKSQNKLLPRLIKNLATNLRIRNVIVCRYMYNVYIQVYKYQVGILLLLHYVTFALFSSHWRTALLRAVATFQGSEIMS